MEDGGISGEGVFDFGWAELTSISAYRYNKYTRGQDADYNNLDILYRASDGGSFNRFNTLSQELRLQGNSWNNRLDWLIGGYYANEKLKVVDNLAYGNDYAQFSNCLVAANFASGTGQAALVNPLSPTCFNPAVAGAILPYLPASQQTALAAFARLGAFAGAPFGNSGFSNLATASGLPGQTMNGNAVSDNWNQGSDNWALFTHNIFSITDQLKLTAGLRYTHETKTLNAALTDNNVLCSFYSTYIPALQILPCVNPSVPGGSLNLNDRLFESKLSGTAVLSYKPTDRILTYASYSRGYKSGGFNLDRSALVRSNGNGAVLPTTNADALKFKAEGNDAFEVGAKYNGPGFDLNVAVFHELFSNFQLNTFNGLNFVVENVNSCSTSLNGADSDNDPTTGACTAKLRPGVVSQGFELELFTRPMRDLAINGGVTMADVKYRDNLVGADGRPLTNALFQLPNRRISNAPQWTLTGSLAWTPALGNSGLHGLFYVDARYMSEFNTGSDLDIEKTQKGFAVVNGRIGVRGPNDSWALEFWAQNLFKQNYIQVAFDAPIQGSGTTRGVEAGFYPRSTQLYGAFLGEPRTFGATLRGKLGFARPTPIAYTPPPAPPPPVIEQPAPPPPPPPPPPPAPTTQGERG